MARPLRIIHSSGWYHITARGNEQRSIYRDDQDRAHFIELLAEMVLRFQVALHTYVLMENHYHLLLGLTEPNLSRAVQWLNVSYSVWFNRRHNRCGHLFQGRFKSIIVEPPAWGLALSAYIHLNPVRVARLKLSKTNRQRTRAGAGRLPERSMVQERLSLLRAYRWSSFRPYVGLSRKPEWLECDQVLALGGGPVGEQRSNYRRYVENQVREGLGETPWESLTGQVVLGGAAFLGQLRENVRDAFRGEPPPRRLMCGPVDLQMIIGVVEKLRGESWDSFKNRHGDRGRGLVLYLARRLSSLKVSELAKAMGMKHDANVSVAVKRYQLELDSNRSEKALAKKATKMLFVSN